MAVRTKELGTAKGNVPPAILTIYTCPTGHTAILKDVTGKIGGAATFLLFITRGVFTYTVIDRAAPAAEVITLTGRFIVLEPGDKLQCFWTTNNAGHQVWCTGSDRDRVA